MYHSREMSPVRSSSNGTRGGVMGVGVALGAVITHPSG